MPMRMYFDMVAYPYVFDMFGFDLNISLEI